MKKCYELWDSHALYTQVSLLWVDVRHLGRVRYFHCKTTVTHDVPHDKYILTSASSSGVCHICMSYKLVSCLHLKMYGSLGQVFPYDSYSYRAEVL